MQVQKRIGLAIMALLMSLSLPLFSAAAEPVRLSDFKWKNRLLIGCDRVNSERHPRHRKLAIDLVKIALADTDRSRKLAIVNVDTSSWSVLVDAPEHLSTGYTSLDYICPDCGYAFPEDHRRQIVNRLVCAEGDQVTALIGLDGQIKQAWRNEPPSADQVFALIDAMPMRQQELQTAPPEELTE